MTYQIVFVPKPGGSLGDAVAAVDRGEDVSDTERDTWFERLVPAARGVLGDVDVDVAARSVVHPPTGIRLEVRGGGVVTEVPYEGEVDPLTLMTLVHTLAGDVERATGLVGWDPQLGEPVSTRLAAVLRAPPRPQPRDDEVDAGGWPGGTHGAPAATEQPPAQREPHPHRPWWRFWARR